MFSSHGGHLTKPKHWFSQNLAYLFYLFRPFYCCIMYCIYENFEGLGEDWPTYLFTKIESGYDQEIAQSQTADKPMTTRGRASQQSQDSRKTN